MEVTVFFLSILAAHVLLTSLNIRAGLLLLVLVYGLYPKLLSLGVSSEGFALSGQRAMLYVLLGFFLLRYLWNSAEFERGAALYGRYRRLFLFIAIYLGARLVGNVLSGRFDVGSFAAFVNEFVVSMLVVMLVVTYVRSRNAVVLVLGLVVVSLVLNQLVAIVEFASGQSLFPANLELQFATGDDQAKLIEGRMRAGVIRARGFFDNPLKLAGFLCLVLPVAIGMLRSNAASWVRIVAATALLLALPTAILTGSRTAVAVTLLILVWIVYSYLVRRANRGSKLVLRATATVAAVLLVAAIAAGGDSLLMGSEYARSTESRVFQFVRVPLALAGAPVFGYGYARNIIDLVEAGHVDSFFLQTALEGGAVAVLALLAAMLTALRLIREVLRESTDADTVIIARAIGVAIGFAFLLALVLSLAHIRFYVFLYIGLAVALHSLPAEIPAKQRVKTQVPVTKIAV